MYFNNNYYSAIRRFPIETKDSTGGGRSCNRQSRVREVASIQRDKRCHLRRDDVRRLSRRRQGLVSGRQRWPADARENGQVVPNRDCLSWIFVCSGRSTWHLSSSGQDSRLDYLRDKLVATGRFSFIFIVSNLLCF